MINNSRMEVLSQNQNQTIIYYTEFVLFGFPGIIEHRKLLVIPFLVIYITILAGNIVVIHQIFIQPKLHSPMYFLMSLLFSASISCTTSVLPKFLLGLSLDMNQISLVGCLIQMFCIYFLGGFESGVILMMALDRFIAICRPLRYNDIMTKRLVVQLVLIGILRSMFFVCPTVILTSSLCFCRSNIIQNFVCENMGLLSLACADISKVQLVGLLIKTFVTVTDVSFLLVSYSSILYAALKMITGKARHKALHTCVTHMVVAVLIYACSLLASVVYRLHTHMSDDVKNLFNAIYLLIPAALNPFIYGVGVSEIRRCMAKTWKSKNAICIYFLGGFESGVILMMALDRFIAICRPLRYNDIMTTRFLGLLVLLGIAQGLLLILPGVLLTSAVHFCRSNIILNFVCENMGLLSLACDDISKVHVVGLLVKIFGTLLDFGLLLVSYSCILYTAKKIIVGKARHKALHTCITHLTVATFIYVCSLITSIVYRMRTYISCDVQNLFNAIYLTLPASANPFIYGIGAPPNVCVKIYFSNDELHEIY